MADELRTLIIRSLDSAEMVWAEHGALLEKSEKLARAITDHAESDIPGHPVVYEDVSVVDDFIALVADMRGSSDHLVTRISPRNAEVSELQRVYYETSALLPALAWIVDKHKGRVTEYLGDGVLALFPAKPQPACVYDAYDAAHACVTTVRTALNQELNARYRLPPVDVGVGLALSKCVVHLVGLPGARRHPKAIGKCVYYASKLAGEVNIVCVDEVLHALWPKEKDGPLRFRKVILGKLLAYVVADQRDGA